VIEGLRIRGLGVIAEAQIEFGAGLTVITGETGAGKTMVVTSLGLLLGGKADAGAVRSGQERAEASAWLGVEPNSIVVERVLAAGGEIEDGVLLVSRTVSVDGRSRAFAGGRSVPIGVLADLGSDLIAVHGQSEQLLLLRSERRRAALDRYAGEPVAKAVEKYRTAYEGLRDIEQRLERLSESDQDRLFRLESWRAGLSEIAAVDPRPGEDDALAMEIDRLANSESLRLAAQGAHDALRNEGGAGDALAAVLAARRLLQAEAGLDPELSALADRLGDLATQLADIADELGRAVSDLDAEPARLDKLQQRRAEVTALRRRFGGAGGSLDAVLRWAEDASNGLVELDDSEERLAELRRLAASARIRCGDAAEQLSGLRTDAAARFGAAVTEVEVQQTPAIAGLEVGDGRRVAYGPSGTDEVEFLLTPHRGAAERPIGRGASGGELSRVMLAIEVVFAGADPVPTFVFDEVDAGVGGESAIELGRRLARLSRSAQVIVVTHLAQVAVFADRHLVVVKADDGSVTEAGVVGVAGEARIRELARMLGGVSDSTAAAEHVRELLELAADAKVERGPTKPRRSKGTKT
jgi:DNA repair protein RecN (Recombination protein N)